MSDPIEIVTPVHRLIRQFGADRLAVWTGRHRSRVYAWAWRPPRGAGGIVPVRLREAIMAGAMRDLGVTLELRDFEPGPGEAYDFGGEPS